MGRLVLPAALVTEIVGFRLSIFDFNRLFSSPTESTFGYHLYFYIIRFQIAFWLVLHT